MVFVVAVVVGCLARRTLGCCICGIVGVSVVCFSGLGDGVWFWV